MALAFKKTNDNIAPPPNDASDFSSGMQPATSNGVISVVSEVALENAPGQSIGFAPSDLFHESVA